jgi:Protein of unknown function (DUF3131)
MERRAMLKGAASMAVGAGLSGCGAIIRSSAVALDEYRNSEIWYQGRHGQLDEEEQLFAKTAWSYFINNYNPETGLVNSVDKYPSLTLWHVGDYLAALVIAFEFKLIEKKEFDERLSALLEFLNKIGLCAGRLPNKAYHAHTGEMVGYDNKPGEIGWSAIDIGRLLIWLKIVASRYSHFTEYVERAVLRWDFCGLGKTARYTAAVRARMLSEPMSNWALDTSNMPGRGSGSGVLKPCASRTSMFAMVLLSIILSSTMIALARGTRVL